ncbi:efflux RND transporter periplasmic adaptor subunit [Rugamonas sp.]|uniref:efflux RND transporter periplasmic adaptor subunit n=1 Tax=Rugamonas sp. TaxID=1926287 RepID=UPI0025E081F0|nr:efflux RND transporter periplasmic adaptor subunit [Rugamonas sp.]
MNTRIAATIKTSLATALPARTAHAAGLIANLLACFTAYFTASLLLLPLTACHAPDANANMDNAAAPLLVRQGERINVPANSPLRARLTVAAVAASSAAHTVTLPAVVEADPARSVNIVPPLTGRLLELKVKLGDSVKAGQLLAVIAAPELAQAVADADKARDARALAQHALQRAHGVNEAGANASKDLELAESNFAQAAAEATRADSRLKTLGANNSNGNGSGRTLSLTAPISGTVTALASGAGAYLNDPTAALMTIASLDPVWITAYVPENLVAAVGKGAAASASLPAYPGLALKGTVAFVGAALEADSHRNKARISFANADGKLKPNMYASVGLVLPQAAQVSVPASALLMNNDSSTVFVEVAPWTYQRRSVELGAEDGDAVRIVSGLRAGERIVTRGGVLLND